MTKIEFLSGFLGAARPTLIKKLLAEAYQAAKSIVLIEKRIRRGSTFDGGFPEGVRIEISGDGPRAAISMLPRWADINQGAEGGGGAVPPRTASSMSRAAWASSRDVIVADGGHRQGRVPGRAPSHFNSYRHRGQTPARVKVYMKNFGEVLQQPDRGRPPTFFPARRSSRREV